ncbi:entry exclusion protein TrbK [Chelatococcus asaccharovorans]|uniref:entry exclusion protein TrbK n=1 Tax=Chelatococcus asaccharovorans TaxID=28210 RepID=UPI00224C6FD6|nr:entry exclusion protein TrbK [Chelatococcus asaccharovorans]CAH1648070.1 Ti type entry exclusion protein TrbK [Chelatococcus asaccharovorans]CAH1687175.1 Ti type entry exclusion protein TrbK [Chelatococcus asaccharovorans]
MSRATIIILVVGVVSLGVVAFWVVLPRTGEPVVTNPAPTAEDAERRQRAEKFFGGDPDRDVRGGQQMKPRW